MIWSVAVFYIGMGIGWVLGDIGRAKGRGERLPRWHQMLWMIPLAVLGWPYTVWVQFGWIAFAFYAVMTAVAFAVLQLMLHVIGLLLI